MPLPSKPGLAVAWFLSLCWVPWAAVSTLGLGADRWWLAVWLPLGTYVLAFTAGALVFAFTLRAWRAATAGAIGLAALGLLLQDRALADPQPVVANGTSFTVLALNLDQGRADPTAVAALVRRERIDAAAFIELTPASVEDLDRAGLRVLLPSRQMVPAEGAGGIGAFSRLPSDWDRALLPPDRPWMPIVVDLPGAGRVRFEAVRSPPPRPKTAARFATEDPLAALPGGVADPVPVIVAGDLNASLDNHRVRTFLDRGFRDAAAETGQGLVPTWSGLGGAARLTLDHVLVSTSIAVEAVDVVKISGTDHRAVVARLRIPAG